MIKTVKHDICDRTIRENLNAQVAIDCGQNRVAYDYDAQHIHGVTLDDSAAMSGKEAKGQVSVAIKFLSGEVIIITGLENTLHHVLVACCGCASSLDQKNVALAIFPQHSPFCIVRISDGDFVPLASFFKEGTCYGR